MVHKIDNIEIKNFKSIRHQKIEGCKRINVFIGYPNVGKSNILEALTLYSIDSYNNFPKLIRLENSTSLFFNGNISEKGEVVINSNNRITLTYMSDFLRLIRQINKGNENFDILDKLIETIDLASIMTVDFEHKNLVGKSFSGSNFSNDERALSRINKYQFENETKFISTASNNLSAPFGENIFDVISSDISIRKEVGEMFKDYDLKFSFDKSTREFKILKNVGDDIFLVSYSMIADTLRRLIFYKTAIHSNKDSILLFEEPEAHMFPPYIKKLTTDILLDKTNQFFIATHSPYVLDELILEGGDDLSVYLVDYKDGETIIHYLSSEDLSEIRQYGVDLFFNIESYLKHGQINHP